MRWWHCGIGQKASSHLPTVAAVFGISPNQGAAERDKIRTILGSRTEQEALLK